MNIGQILQNKHTLPYRQGVIGLVVNNQDEILLVQMISYKENQWRFPGGGIDPDESPKKSLERELFEELGSKDFEVKTQSTHIAQFEWPDEQIIRRYEQKGEAYRGQQQTIFLVNFTGKKEDLQLDPKELKQVQWVTIDQLPEYLIFPGQLELTQKVIAELLP